ncbi:hypothetical protein NDU88_012165 [Pleurodeles waltl]|uniref:Uncharacterized protein n=1 Tax=Pleurodeles waltl TaxID=8319 RepID=A0AAV7R243_PLEWA|nr:hypothetical protein NDU88_012165 [Pleurodeles waltl]
MIIPCVEAHYQLKTHEKGKDPGIRDTLVRVPGKAYDNAAEYDEPTEAKKCRRVNTRIVEKEKGLWF